MEKNIVVVGCGYWGKNLVRNFYELNSLCGIHDVDENRICSCKKQYPEIAVYSRFDQVLEDSAVQAIAIATPASTHYSLAKKALLANKDAFIEKPIALDYQEGLELVSLSEEKNRILMVGHILEYHPAIDKLKSLVDRGELGKIQYIYSNRLNLGKFRTEENILWSFAPHDIDVILYLLNEMPQEISAHGGNYLNPDVADVTITTLNFPSGAKAHIFVSWLHPYREQKLVVIGDKKMALFDDLNPINKLLLYNHKIDWFGRTPMPRLREAQPIEIEKTEPLRVECEHFMDCVLKRKTPKTDGRNALRVLHVLDACQELLKSSGRKGPTLRKEQNRHFVHPSAFVDENVEIGDNTKIWHFSHIQSGARLGNNCVLGQNVNVGNNVTIGNFVRVQNNVSIYEGVTLEDYVFCGPSMVFTNIKDPRGKYPQRGSESYQKTLVKEGASLGANCTVVCGVSIGRHAFIGAGAVVTKDVPDYALVIGNPARIVGWMSEAGKRLKFNHQQRAYCEKSKKHYELKNGKLEEIRDPD